jgi:hypothetical protein
MTAWIRTREETNSEFVEGFHSCFSFFLFWVHEQVFSFQFCDIKNFGKPYRWPQIPLLQCRKRAVFIPYLVVINEKSEFANML